MSQIVYTVRGLVKTPQGFFMDKVYLTVDLGGTRIRAARHTPDGTIEARTEQFTQAEDGADATIHRLAESLREVWPSQGWPEMISIGAPGPVDPFTGVVHIAPNLPGFLEMPLRDRVQTLFDVSVVVGNDANLASLAEWRFGAGRGHHDMIYLTISTGIGGGVISGDHLLLGSSGLAGELGHVSVNEFGDVCQCGNIGCIEAIASGTGLVKQVRQRLPDGEPSLILELAGGDSDMINVEILELAAKAGDVLAQQVFQRSFHALGLSIVSLLHAFNPSIVVIGGGVSNMGDMLFEPVRATVHKHAMNERFICPIVRAELKGDVGLLGALALALDPPPQRAV
jgi:glucokinase